MRKLLGLAILCAVLGICAPSYGYFLVYNISSTVHGSDRDIDLINSIYSTGHGSDKYINPKVTIPLKGYLALKLSDSNDAVVDANLILYGKDYFGSKVYYLLDPVDGNSQFRAESRRISKDVFFALLGGNPYHFEMQLSGMTTSKDIGLGTGNRKNVAGSLKGVNTVWTGFVLGPYTCQDVSGNASVSAVLVNALTIYANEHNRTQEQILYGDSIQDGLLDILDAKGYSKGPCSGGGNIGGSITATVGGNNAYGIYSEGSIEIGTISGGIQDANIVSP